MAVKCEIEVEFDKLMQLSKESNTFSIDDINECPGHVSSDDLGSGGGEGDVHALKRLKAVEAGINHALFTHDTGLLVQQSHSMYNLVPEQEKRLIASYAIEILLNAALKDSAPVQIHTKMHDLKYDVKKSVGFYNIYKVAKVEVSTSESDGLEEVDLKKIDDDEDEINAKKRGSLKRTMKTMKRSISNSNLWTRVKGCFSRTDPKRNAKDE